MSLVLVWLPATPGANSRPWVDGKIPEYRKWSEIGGFAAMQREPPDLSGKLPNHANATANQTSESTIEIH